ncbi:MCE family protein [Amycolatopsis endophytica]|uniref:Virulence factor Mce-like protein n=1 Tax=Amycolatopsis endophytica TaxID=860233 RepID=A0A853B820_9PSEU|nr:MCE family protein [Amycolatopsis endophytica]NYI90922.1 virulence factor Mce-like protein [Amycolatopsis endophytica]
MAVGRLGRWLRWGALVVILATLATAIVVVVRDAGRGKHLTAYFTAAVGIYPGSEVRILGVPVGTVDTVEPQGQQVKVGFSVDHGIHVPADAAALVVTPSLVSDRYVQLAPVYRGGPEIADGTVIPVGRTAVPVELDQLFASLDRLTTALGPQGANGDGALSDLLSSASEDLTGNGAQLGEMIRRLGQAATTLSGSRDDLFATVDNLQRFTTMLADNDSQVDRLADLLAQVSSFLASERDAFSGALPELAPALGQIQQFVQDNRGRIKSNVDKLMGTTQMLANQRASLTEALNTAPDALDRLLAAYDPAHSTIYSRADLNEFSMGPALPLGGS